MAETPVAVRVLPMSSKDPDFNLGPGRPKSAEQAQRDFFLHDLPTKKRPGEYLFPSHALNAEPGTMVLFQYRGRIIASAILQDIKRFDEPIKDKGEFYCGAFYFDVHSIRVFDPVDSDRMKEIWPQEFKRFCQAPLDLDPKRYPLFAQGLAGVVLARDGDTGTLNDELAPVKVRPPADSFEVPTSTPQSMLPPIPDAESLLARIRQLRGLPERNHEDVVRDLFVRLGFKPAAIVFQKGRIDIRILDSRRQPAAVVEVKRTIATESERSKARRQAMDYAGDTSAPVMVITDGDRYEVYDCRKGPGYDAMLCGKFRLTSFCEQDTKALDLLRPDYLCGGTVLPRVVP